MKFYGNRILRNIPVAVFTLLLLAANPLHIPPDQPAAALSVINNKKDEVREEIIDWNPQTLRKYAKGLLDEYGWDTPEQWTCLNRLWGKESAWNHESVYDPTDDYGVPQRHMSRNSPEEIKDFMADPQGQIRWGLSYIAHRYDTPCGAWNFWHHQGNRWY